ncbi:dTDP-4-dehydrorhamnose reductase (plasmid) [Leisingera caerulea]|uniref:dTDP-4-dehydrorhamnose reductase n=1 Tax=Leisingera caerulea TaxID=506591 RepID=A0ABY5X3I3_LEICA|nr:dTDP-4-dehydrorhamnose reductase [Leisingera caerulea]UWQ61089.1 dTDP-4-dehydrorhamnose reductase [Leisingera caerulea]UWQ64770.1 dTDP-4-dehydrorhamnose reductase [Leisingera caerulea]
MTILVFGKTGQLARELAAYDNVTCLGRDQADLSHPAACAAAIRQAQPQAVINAAAYTAVDKAEEEEALATVINGAAPGAMAAACAEIGIPFVTLSTDYVFDGSGEAPWQPGEATAPLNAYGRSKLAGEDAVRAAGGTYAVLRTSWVVSCHGNNFVKTMLRLGKDRERLTIVADQIGAPTPARDIAAACLEIARQLQQDPGKSGTYHFAGAPQTSWAGFAREIFARAGVDCAVEDIPTAEYPAPAARPLNSRLDCAALETVFGIPQPDWRLGLDDILKDLGEVA